jgi:serine/threonine-protein kinase
MICPRCHFRYGADHLFCGRDGERLVEVVDIRRVRSKPTGAQGTLIGERYQVRGLLGKGGMAQVFLAFDQKTKQPVAVKVMGTRHLADKRLVARFLQEAKAAAEVTHPGVVEVLDVGLADDGSPFLVMELLVGETLGDRLRSDKNLTPELGLPFVRQVAEALALVHRAGIVHRDVKPDNVFLVGEKGDPHTAKLLDFGYAKLGQQGVLTEVGVAVGTVEYMSPEQAVGDTVDARTDVYGLGVLMYRMFAGQLPFTAGEATGMLAMHLAEEPPSLALPGLDAIVRKAMRKSPDHRYASMEALIGDLIHLERGEPLAARLPLAESDVYVPRQQFAGQVTAFLHKKLGKEPPR